jgi:hypothetical protein
MVVEPVFTCGWIIAQLFLRDLRWREIDDETPPDQVCQNVDC